MSVLLSAVLTPQVQLAQLSDTHLTADPAERVWGHNTTANLDAVVATLPATIDVLVVTGDIAEDGERVAYERASSMTDGVAPERFFVPGNHDDAAAMRDVFGATPAVQMARLSDHWTLALLNSQWPGHEQGRIGTETLEVLRVELGRVRGHVAVCVHHPPLSPCDDEGCGMSDADQLRAVLQEAGNVRVVLSGHVHKAFDETRGGVWYLGGPSTFRQLEHGGSPHFRDTDSPPAARLVDLHDNGDIATRVVVAEPPTRLK